MSSEFSTTPPGEPAGRLSRSDVETAKSVLRSRIRAHRLRRPQQQRHELAAALREVALQSPVLRSASVVTCYLDGPTEPGTGPLREALGASGTRVLLPVVSREGDEPSLDWALDDGTAEPGAYLSLPEPTGRRLGHAAIGDADVVLVPALAVDTLGRRLGQGGGFYDRALVRARIDAPVVAVVHDDELLDADVEPVPALPHDRRVDAVLTPTRWVSVRR